MDLLNDIGRRVTVAAKSITKKSEDMVELTKLNLAINNEEEKIRRMLYEIGSELYRSYTNDKTFGDFFDGRCSDIKQLEENIRSLKEKALLLKGSKMCKACSSAVGLEVNYCPNCGNRLENKEE